MSKFGEIPMKREIRPGEYEGILKKLKDAAPPEELFNKVFKAYNNSKFSVRVGREKWKDVSELLRAGIYPPEDLGRFKKVNYEFWEQVEYKNGGVVSISFPTLIRGYAFNYYYVESRQQPPHDYGPVTRKEQRRRNWISELEKSNAIGLSTPLTGEQYTSLFDCCTPINDEYLKGLVKEAERIPCLSPELVLEYVKDCFVKVYGAPSLPVPTEKEREGRCFWFGKFF